MVSGRSAVIFWAIRSFSSATTSTVKTRDGEKGAVALVPVNTSPKPRRCPLLPRLPELCQVDIPPDTVEVLLTREKGDGTVGSNGGAPLPSAVRR